MFGRNKQEHTTGELVQIVTLEELQRADRVLKEAAAFRRVALEIEGDALEAYDVARKQHKQALGA